MLVQDKEKVRPALQCQTNREEKYLITSIPQVDSSKHLAIEMEQVKLRDPIGIDSFPLGTVRSFRLYLKAQRLFLEAEILLP